MESNNYELSEDKNPFIIVAEKLETATKGLDGIYNNATTARDQVAVLDDCFTSVCQITSALDTMTFASRTFQECLGILEAIPFVGGVAGALQTGMSMLTTFLKTTRSSFDKIEKDLIAPCKKVFDKLKKGLSKIASLLNIISKDIPNYINTMNMLSCLLDIGEPLIGILKNPSDPSAETPASRLEVFLQVLRRLKDSVLQIIEPSLGWIASIAEILKPLKEIFSSTVTNIAKSVKDFTQKVQGVVQDVLNPIISAVNAIKEAVAPVKWVLDAVKCVMEKILQPIIDKVLEWTGIRSLLDRVLRGILDSLGLGDLFNMIESFNKAQEENKWGDTFAEEAADHKTNNWLQLANLLKDYNTRDNPDMKSKLFDLLKLVCGCPLDPDALPPMIPPQEDIELPISPHFEAAVAEFELHKEVQNGFVRLSSLSETAEYVANLSFTKDSEQLNCITPYTVLSFIKIRRTVAIAEVTYAMMPEEGLALIKVLANRSLDDIEKAQDILPNLLQKLSCLDLAAPLHSNFHTQMQNFSNLFKDASKFMEFLQQFELLRPICDQFNTSLLSHSELAIKVQSATEALIPQSANLVETVRYHLENLAPKNQLFSQALLFVEGCIESAKSLEDLLNQLRDHAETDQMKIALQELESDIEKAATNAVDQFKTIHSLVDTCLKLSDQIDGILVEYGGLHKNLQTEVDDVATNGFKQLQTTNYYAGLFTSILDPLTTLFKIDTPSSDSKKRETIELIHAIIKMVLAQNKNLLTNALSYVIDKLVPLHLIEEKVICVGNFLEANHNEFDSLLKSLEANFITLTEELKPKNTYVVKDIPTSNIFLNEELVTKAKKLIQSLNIITGSLKIVKDSEIYRLGCKLDGGGESEFIAIISKEFEEKPYFAFIPYGDKQCKILLNGGPYRLTSSPTSSQILFSKEEKEGQLWSLIPQEDSDYFTIKQTDQFLSVDQGSLNVILKKEGDLLWQIGAQKSKLPEPLDSD